MNDLVNISIPNAGIIALLGYLVVFLGLVMLMVVVMVMGRIMVARARKAQAAAVAEAAPVEAAPVAEAPGTAGELKLYDTDPRDAAMIMAIVADTLGKPLNQLRFISIKEVKDDEV
ncbi:MAG: OadG family transporter subunit [bacterium]|nr:OadG family protein [Oscillospiraceae bacterium]MDO5413670.1 OadG family transporter subunit [bacterium]MDY4634161.1 OadG family transporter subunit [Candidatus Limivicinus sp.]MDY5564292.1 OadG family transporter subunit [Candidatus Limivicinus sp.]